MIDTMSIAKHNAMRHLGIYSGTFDPLHAGHVASAREARRVGQLDGVVFMPEEEPRGKSGVTGIGRRIEQIRSRIDPVREEVYRARHPRFTIKHTLPELMEQYPDTTLSFLFGSDVISSLHTWPNIAPFLARHHLFIGMRAGDDRDDVTSALEYLGASYTIIAAPFAHLSSKQIRATIDI